MTTQISIEPVTPHGVAGALVDRVWAPLKARWAPKWKRFKVSFHAWWEGYELIDASAKKKAASSGVDGAAPAQTWSEARISVSQMIWGDGFTFPGGIDYAVEMAKPLNLNSKKSLLDVGCGLGGATRAFHKTFGCWVTGIEMSPELAAEGAKLSKQKGLARQATVQGFDPATVAIPAHKFDAAFARHVLTPTTDKKRLLTQIVGAVRPGGYVSLLDFGLSTEFKPSAEFEEWRAAEGCPELPYTLADYGRILDELGVDVCISEDISAKLRGMVVAGWENLAKQIAGKTLEPAETGELAQEIGLWGKRLAALKCGNLTAIRVFGMVRLNTVVK